MTDDVARVVLLACVVLTGLLAPAALAAQPTLSPEQSPPGGFGAAPFAQQNVDADRVVLDVRVYENGTATWRVAYRVELETDNETAAFKSLQADIRANTSTYLAAFRDRMERTVRTAENATARSMTLRGFDVTTGIESVQQYGTVEYSFTWEGFAATDGDTIRVGDALAGFFLESNSRLSITWPAGYDATVNPEPDDRRDRTAVWTGPIEFGPDGPAVVAKPASSGGSIPVAFLAVGAVLAVGMGAAIWLVFKRDMFSGGETEEPTAQADTAAPAEESPASAPKPDEELLSNEERVLRLLEDRGGRVKQQEVASEFDWTDAKTSQVVGQLRDDDEIDVFRLGRENVLVDPEESEL